MKEQLFTYAEAAFILKYGRNEPSADAVRRAVSRGHLKCVRKHEGGRPFIARSEIVRILRGQGRSESEIETATSPGGASPVGIPPPHAAHSLSRFGQLSCGQATESSSPAIDLVSA